MTEEREIDDDLGFQRRSWALQRAGWLALVMWLTASGAGVTGPGPWSHVRADQGSVSIEYDRSLHLDAPTRLVVSLDCDRPGTVEIGLGGDHVESFEVVTAVPRPAAESIGPRERRLSLVVSEPGVVRLELRIVPRRSGRQITRLRLGEATLDPIRQFVFP
jgi:hypothetical protein